MTGVCLCILHQSYFDYYCRDRELSYIGGIGFQCTPPLEGAGVFNVPEGDSPQNTEPPFIRPFTVPRMHRCIWRQAPNLHYIYTKFLMDLWDHTGLSSSEKCILCGNTVRTCLFEVWRWENLTHIAVCLVCYWAIIRGLKCLTTCQNAL